MVTTALWDSTAGTFHSGHLNSVCCSCKEPVLQGALHACVQLVMVKPAWTVQVLSALPLQLGWEWSTTCPRVVVDGGQVYPIHWAGDRSRVRFLL